MRTPVSAPELEKMLEAERLRATTPTNVSLGTPEKFRPGTPQAAGVEFADVQTSFAEVAAMSNRAVQAHVDHIQRRDRNWDDALRGQS